MKTIKKTIFYGDIDKYEIVQLATNEFTSNWLNIYLSFFLGKKILSLLLELARLKYNNDLAELLFKHPIEESTLVDNIFKFEEPLKTLIIECQEYKLIGSIKNEIKIIKNEFSYFVQKFGEGFSFEESASVLSCIIATLIEENEINLHDSESIEVIFVCHDKHIGQYRTDFIFNDNQKENFKSKTKEILSAKLNSDELEKIQIKEIISFQHVEHLPTIKHFKESQGRDICGLVAKLKGELAIESLSNTKKKLINTFLPLTIDIQGLSEIVKKDFKKGERYYRDIRSEFRNMENEETEYFTSLKDFLRDFSNWNEIENNLEDDYKKFKPEVLVNEIFENSDLADTFIKNYLDPGNTSKFLPSWLKNVVEVIDNEIKKSTDANDSSKQ